MKKFLLLFPPFWDICSIHIAHPLLNAQLKSNGFNSKVKDLNINFLNDTLNKTFLENALIKIKNDWEILSKQNLLNENKLTIARYEELKYFIENEIEEFKNIPQHIQNSIEIVKNLSDENNNENSFIHFEIIHKAIRIVTLYYSTFSIHLPIEMMKFEIVKELILSSQYNLFYNFYENKIDSIIEDANIIGINISYYAQIIPALTLAYLIKQKTKVKVVLGGTYITRIYRSIINYPEFFDIFTDYILYGEGETSIVQLAKYMKDEIPINKVTGLIYKKNNEIKINKLGKNIPISKTLMPDYSDLNFSDYIIGEKVLPLQTQRGCYWKKCAFCDMSEGMNYCIKDVKNIIEEIKFYINTYGITSYTIVDESMPPVLIEKISDEIIKNNLTIKFDMISRLEKSFTPKILEKAVKAGLQRVYWGVESANRRISKLMNKGIDLKTMEKVLENSKKAGIKNAIFIILNFPTETYNEALDTINFVSKNKENIDIVILYEYRLSKYSKMALNPQKYGISIKKEQMEFSTIYNYESDGLTAEEKNNIKKMIQEINSSMHSSSKIN